GGLVLLLGLVPPSIGAAGPHAQKAAGDQARSHLIELTEAALLDQIRCQHHPQVGRAINAMLANRLIRYVENESGTYLFAVSQPMTFLGLPITYVAGFDIDEAFEGGPGSRMLGPAPSSFLEIDVAAPAAEL